MNEVLNELQLPSGETMLIVRITAPDNEFDGRINELLAYTGDLYTRDIRQRLAGKYQDVCVDKYFLGVIDGEVAGNIYYGYPAAGSRIGNFGHVYTALKHRKKGVTTHLMNYFLDDFHSSPAKLLLCATGTPWVASFYLKYGFQLITPNADCGPLALFNESNQTKYSDFAEFAAEYFATTDNFEIKEGTMAEVFDIDKMLAYELILHNEPPMRVALNYAVQSYREAIFKSEDGHGFTVVAKTKNNSVPAWGYFLNLASEYEEHSRIFDFFIHPAFKAQTSNFVANSLRLAERNGIKSVYSYISGSEKSKIDILKQSGFSVAAEIADYCRVSDTSTSPLVILNLNIGI